MTTYRFAPHAVRAKKSVKCAACGKRMTRQTTFEQTQNPFNVNRETGLPKTLPEIYAELNAKASEWEADSEGYLCVKCEFPEPAA